MINEIDEVDAPRTGISVPYGGVVNVAISNEGAST